MQPRLSIIAAAIRRILTSGFVEPTSDPYWDNVVLSLRMESSDPYYNQVVLGMHMDDTGLTDVKGKTGTLTGNVARSATQSKFGGYSAAFDGTGDYISFADHADFYLGSTFTIEAWIYCNSFTDENIICSQTNSGSNGEQFFGVDTSGNVFIITYNGSWVFTYGPAPIAINTWYHVAVTCNAGVTKVFVNGIHGSAGTFTNWSDRAVNFIVGATLNPGASSYSYTNGYIDDLRITKGVARYTKNFSIPTAAFPEPVNTAIDDKGKTVTSNGNAQYSGVSKYGTGSFYFDGVGDYLTIAHASDFNFGNSDFTIEFWYMPIAQTAYSSIIGGDEPDQPLALYHGTAVTGGVPCWAFGPSSAAWFTNANSMILTSLTNGVWYHMAVVRIGDTFKAYVNGVLAATGSTDSSRQSVGNIGTFTIGKNSTYYITCYIDDLRITKGVARYTANFTPYKILTTAPSGDPWYNYTALLLKMNGTNGSTTFTDESYTPKTMTVFGNSNISTAQLKYGTASGYFDGTGDYLRTPYSSGFDPGATGDYTAECWIYPTNVTSLRAIFGPYCNPSATQGWIMYQGANGELALTTRDIAGTSGGVVSASGVLVINQWQHIAWTKTGKVHKLWHNGIKVAEATDTLDLYVNPSYGFIIGRWDDSGTTGRDFVGYMDDIRLTKGAARYTANFQPPGPHIAAIDPNTDQWCLHTVLALRMDGTHGSTTFTDLKGKTVTPYGNTSISSAVSKFGQAAYFDGTGDYLSVTGPSFGTGDFCVEGWVYPTVNNNALILFDTRTADNDSTGFAFYLGSTGKLAYIYGNGVVVEGTTTYSANAWHHVAVTRISGTVKLYLNGAQEASFAQANNYSNTAWKIGHQWSVTGSLTPGYIDDLRVTQGVGRYTAAFTPSEKPLPTYVVGPDHDPYWDKVILACPFDTNANDARNHTPTLVGNTAVSTAQKMFGTGSAYFDGTGDYITFPDSDDWHLASNNFTIEAWIRPTGYPANNGGGYAMGIVTQSLSTSKSFQFGVNGSASAITGLYFSGNEDQSLNTDVIAPCFLALNTWYHVAAVRNGNLIYLFVDGVCLNPGGTAFSRNIQNSTTTLKIGALDYDATFQYYFNGYIDDVRLTKGVGRYTANFELPTKANILG